MFERFDGTGRTPRQQQKTVLDHIARTWHTTDIWAIQAPCGTGKQAIARALQLEHGGAYLAPNNVLVQQAIDTYPDVNYLVGKLHYECKEMPELSCEDRQRVKGHRGCSDCKYRAARNKALSGEPTVYNPISYYYSQFDKRYRVPNVLVIDEAHKLLELLGLLTAISFGERARPPLGMNTRQLTEWLQQRIGRLQSGLCREGVLDDRAVVITDEIEKLERIVFTLQTNPGDMHHWYEKGVLKIAPIDVPRHIVNQVIRAQKLVLLSATLFKQDVVDIVGEGVQFDYLELDSPIPAEQRQVIAEPAPLNINYESSMAFLAGQAKSLLERYPSPSTIVHCTYDVAKRLKDLLPDAMWNTPENKRQVLNRFKKKGGLWLAAGCAEGLDLYDDYCRLNVILRLHKQNIADPVVQQKLARNCGQRRYDLDILRTVIQQAGRSTRHEKDSSKVVIIDPLFPRLFKKYKSSLPKSFIESVVINEGG